MRCGIGDIIGVSMVTPHYKQTGFVDPAFLKWKPKTCVVHLDRGGEVHHLKARGMGGKGQKCDDYETVVLCRQCHSELHTLGLWEFNRVHHVDCYRSALRDTLLYVKWGGTLYDVPDEGG